MSKIVVALRCNWCSRQQAPTELMQLSSGQLMCRRCYEWHHKALDFLAGGALPEACQQCHITIEQLNSLDNSPTSRMWAVAKDGIYQFLCTTCKEGYVAKRADLYNQPN